jgi:citrate lyase subunit beta/citryl-CoA lyase
MVFMDLEDAVVPSQKNAARTQVVDALLSIDFGKKVRVVRVNSVESGLAHADIVALFKDAAAIVDCIMIPKVRNSSDVHFIHHLLCNLETESSLGSRIGLEIIIESARAAVSISEISAASDRIQTLIFGAGDYAHSLGVNRFEIGMTNEHYHGHVWHWIMAEISNYAHASGCQPIDGPYVKFNDRKGFELAAQRAKATGFVGKWCIHPNQIPWANDAFSVSRVEVEQAHAVLSAYREAIDAGRGAIALNGLLIDDASRKMAEAVLRSTTKNSVIGPVSVSAESI